MRAHNIPFSIYNRKSPKIIPNLQKCDFFQGTQERLRNSRDKRTISDRATESLLYLIFIPQFTDTQSLARDTL